jgi:long-chain fatty acid transport protein
MPTRSLFIICFFLLFQSALYAGGFQVNLQGQKQAGMGHTGAAFLIDASSIFFNPGAVSFLDSSYSINIGASLIIPRTMYLEPSPGIYTEEMVHNTGTPFSAYTVFKLRKKHPFNVGLGIYTPFGSRVQWPDAWKGQFLIREIDLKTIFIQPTFSWKINENFGVGAGFVYATGGFKLRKGVPVQDTSGAYGEARLEGKAGGYGFNAGIYYTKGKLSLGIDFRSQVAVDVSGGDAEFDVPSSLAEYFPRNKFSSQIRLPQVISLGAAYKASDKLKIAFDVNHVGWSSYDTLSIDFETNTDKLEDINSPRNYKDSFIFRAGGQYSFNEKITARAGAYYDMSPVPDGYLTPETPDANRIGVTTGATLSILEVVNIDVSLLYIEGMKRSDTNIETQFSGTYKNRSVVAGLGIEVVF